MEVTEFIENEDGSATVTFETTPEETKFLVSYAMVDILKKQIEREKENENNINSSISD